MHKVIIKLLFLLTIIGIVGAAGSGAPRPSLNLGEVVTSSGDAAHLSIASVPASLPVYHVDRSQANVRVYPRKMGGRGPDGSITGILTDRQYEDRAREFLKKKGLWHDEMVFDRTSYSASVTGGPEGREITRPMAVSVVFVHSPLDGVPVEGIGAMVDFASHGEIVGWSSSWGDISRPYQERGIIPVQKALNRLARGEGHISAKGPSKGTFYSGSIVYRLTDDERLLAPHYVFRGKDQTGATLDAVVSAIAE